MTTNIVDLRYNMKTVLKAIDRNEQVTVLYRGKRKAFILPVAAEENADMKNHPFFGMYSDREKPVESVMAELRDGRDRLL